MTIQQMQNDFSDIDNILTNDNHVVRRYFRMFLNGDYGQEIFEKYFKQWNKFSNLSTLYLTADNLYRKKRSFIINAFIEFNCFDYDLSRYQVKKFLLNAFKDDIEVLNDILISDAKQVYIELND
tara:strand:- start:1243 stop:1614 length:372 start_codon:yes stop_codon:yes gene_type:complete